MPLKKPRMSKRIPLARQKKMAKRIAKLRTQKRRDAKKNPQGRKKLKKEPGIPNLYPFKEELLEKIEAHNVRLAEERQRKKDARNQKINEARNMGSVLAAAAQRERDYEASKESGDVAASRDRRDLSMRQYHKLFSNVVQSADVVLEILDARDPLGCRCYEAEKVVVADPKKRLVLILNKIDLVPKEVVSKWVKHLRDEFPTIAFRCATEHAGGGGGPRPKGHAATPDSKSKGVIECVGGAALLHLLKNYCRSGGRALQNPTPGETAAAPDADSAIKPAGKKGPKLGITVGVIGFPNVGKSSLINSLKRARAVGVSAMPGYTKEISEIKLDKDISLLDSPGIVFGVGKEGGTPPTQAEMALCGVLSETQVDDPQEAVKLMIERCGNDQPIRERYSLPPNPAASAGFDGDAIRQLLFDVAKRRNMLMRGGVPDIVKAAREIIKSWTSGKIKYWCEAPERREGVHVSASIVSELAPGLDWAKLDELALEPMPEPEPEDDREVIGERIDEIEGAKVEGEKGVCYVDSDMESDEASGSEDDRGEEEGEGEGDEDGDEEEEEGEDYEEDEAEEEGEDDDEDEVSEVTPSTRSKSRTKSTSTTSTTTTTATTSTRTRANQSSKAPVQYEAGGGAQQLNKQRKLQMKKQAKKGRQSSKKPQSDEKPYDFNTDFYRQYW
ncbi:Nuclear GTP-binding protein [Pelomyxa schiedti]|nr:Nuclear GTP-binding protein [Pelomyxa schiedti]